ncbi:MAG: NAD(P)-dependent oxidoreductase [Alicyclobacillaceae bacterium]|nr:NAD(P)-dependent oxidoreductase [Alicyclobacillaceae bacterium]
MTLKPGTTRVGFIGTGVMGLSMAAHILRAGYPLRVYNRTPARAEPLLREGAEWRSSPGALAADADVVITMVGFPSDVEQVYFGEAGILASAKPGTYLIDMTTSTPSLAQRIHRTAKERHLHALDAPVSGGDVGAREGRLSIMVGGDEADFEAVLSVLQRMGTHIVRQGEAGAGQYTKMCNQIAIASNMIGVCEAIAYAKRAGLDPERVLQSITGGAAGSWSLSQLGPRIIKGDFAPGFYVKHFLKDIRIALSSAEELNLDLPGVRLAQRLYEAIASWGEEDSGTQALFKWYQRQWMAEVGVSSD